MFLHFQMICCLSLPFRKKNTASHPTYPRHYTGNTNAPSADYGDTEHEPGYLEPTRRDSDYATIDSHNDVISSQASQQKLMAEHTISTPEHLDKIPGENLQASGNGKTELGYACTSAEYASIDALQNDTGSQTSRQEPTPVTEYTMPSPDNPNMTQGENEQTSWNKDEIGPGHASNEHFQNDPQGSQQEMELTEEPETPTPDYLDKTEGAKEQTSLNDGTTPGSTGTSANSNSAE